MGIIPRERGGNGASYTGLVYLTTYGDMISGQILALVDGLIVPMGDRDMIETVRISSLGH